MEKKYELCEVIGKYLRENKIYADVYPYHEDIPVVDVEIHWGDWKHEHLRAKWLMKEIGAHLVGSVTTEENGSDTYSAVHHFYVGEMAVV